MAASKAQQAVTAKRRSDAIQLRLAGADYDTIATRLGYASRGAAYTDINRALEQRMAEQRQSADVLRRQELERLDRLQTGVWVAAVAGDTKSAEVALRIIDRRIKLLGLDAPVKVSVLTMDAIEAEIARLTEELGVDDGEVPREPGGDELAVGPAEAGAAT